MVANPQTTATCHRPLCEPVSTAVWTTPQPKKTSKYVPTDSARHFLAVVGLTMLTVVSLSTGLAMASRARGFCCFRLLLYGDPRRAEQIVDSVTVALERLNPLGKTTQSIGCYRIATSGRPPMCKVPR